MSQKAYTEKRMKNEPVNNRRLYPAISRNGSLMKLFRKPWLATVLAVVVAGGADVAKACFVRSPQPIDVYKDYVTVDITDQVAVKTYKCVFRNPNNRAVVGGTCFMEVEPGAQIDKMSMEVNGKMVKGKVLDVNEANQVFTDIVRK
ncbi:uncharacterized protein METZ01_LOCUS483428, partial [marine metagenome]